MSLWQRKNPASETTATPETDSDGASPRDVERIRAWLQRASTHDRSGDISAAIDAYANAARQYIERGEHLKAVTIYRRVLELDPARLDIREQVASLYRSSGRAVEAAAEFEALAAASLSGGDTVHGILALEQLVELRPDSIGDRLRLAELYSREQRITRAVEQFRAAATRLLAQQRTDDFIRVGERLLFHDGGDIWALRTMARVYLARGDAHLAMVKVNAMLRSSPSDPDGLELLAESFLALDKIDKALIVIRELARARKGSGDLEKVRVAAHLLRRAANAEGPAEDADAELLQTLEARIAKLRADQATSISGEILPDESSAQLSATDLEPITGADLVEVESSLAPAKPVAAPVPDDEDEDDVLRQAVDEVRVYARYRMFQHALSRLDVLIAKNPKHVGARVLRGELLEKLERVDEAVDAYVRAARLVRKRNPDRATELSWRALALRPDHEEANELAMGVVKPPPPPTSNTPRKRTRLSTARLDAMLSDVTSTKRKRKPGRPPTIGRKWKK